MKTRAQYKVYLTDIFGTTTPLAHVDELNEYLQHSRETQESVSKELGYGDSSKLVTAFKEGMEAAKRQDKESDAFKRYIQIEDLVAKRAYETGDLPLPLENDVEETLQRIYESGGRIMIFSSADVETTRAGMASNGLAHFIEDYHSSSQPEIGSKFRPDAYGAIGRKATVTPDKICYITDSVKEAEAAVKAGVGRVYLIDRESSWTGEKGEYFLINDYRQVAEDTLEQDQPEPLQGAS